MTGNIENLYDAALHGDKKEVDYQLQLLAPTWASNSRDQTEYIGKYKLAKITPIVVAIQKLTKHSGVISYQIAQEAYKIALAVDRNLIHRNVLAAAYILLIDGKVKDYSMVRRLVHLAINEDALIDEDSLKILREFYKLHDVYPYTVAKIVFDVITHSTQSISNVIRLLGILHHKIGGFLFTKASTDGEDLAFIIKIWTLFGYGPSPHQIRKIFKYEYAQWLPAYLIIILEMLRDYGYDFNSKYISQTTNVTVATAIFDAAIHNNTGIRKILIDLILSGRIKITKNITEQVEKINDKNLTNAMIAWKYIKRTDLKNLCRGKKCTYYKQIARDNKLRNIAYQLQLLETENDKSVCGCINTITTSQKRGMIPYTEIYESRSARECDNEFTLDMDNIFELSNEQLLEYIDEAEWKVKNGTKTHPKTHPKYCFDKGDAKKLLVSGVNPYTGTDLSNQFTNDLMNVKPTSTAIGFKDAVEEISTGNISEGAELTDFQQIFTRFKNVLNEINPYLDYEAWATQYTVEDYGKVIPMIAFPGFVANLDLGSIDILLSHEKYVTKLMAVLLNRIENGDITIAAIITGINNMLEYFKVPYAITESVEKVTYFDWSIDALTVKKNELMKEFIAGKMKDQTLMQEIQKIRNALSERSGEM